MAAPYCLPLHHIGSPFSKFVTLSHYQVGYAQIAGISYLNTILQVDSPETNPHEVGILSFDFAWQVTNNNELCSHSDQRYRSSIGIGLFVYAIGASILWYRYMRFSPASV